jgi:hypothetical protein
MLKRVIRQGRSERRGESNIVWYYVEPLSDARTKPVIIFSIPGEGYAS